MKKLLVAILLVLLPMAVNAAVHYDEDLDDYADKSAAESGPWGGTADGRITLASGAEALGGTGKCWKIDWTTGGTIALALPLTSLNLSQVYVRFYYKNVKDEGPSGSISKVLKMFGVRDGDNYANWTLAQGYQQIARLSIGTGAGISNDGTCVLRYGSSSDGCLGDGVVDTYTPDYLGGLPIQDGSWHCIEAFFKYNTTTGGVNNADGAFSLWLNGTKIYGVTGIIMRHPDNSIYFSSASFGDHAQDYLGYYEYFDSIVISDSYIGPLDYEPSCADTPGLCGSENDCTTAGWHWCDGTCQASACEEEPPPTPVKTSTWNVPGTVRVR